MSIRDDNTRKYSKLEKIKGYVHFPEDRSNSLPYLRKEITQCTTVLNQDSGDLEVEERIEDFLKENHLINWCRTIHTMHPLKITGKGNQFLCAISMALWRFCDAATFLRRLLFVSVTDFAKDLLFQRWLRSKDSSETTIEIGFKRVVDLTRCSSVAEESSSELVTDEFPHPLHIFILANIIRRPIVIIGNEDDVYTGLYLPVLSKPEDCTKWPLALAVYDGLFFPLVNEEGLSTPQKRAEFAIPLVSSELHPYKVMFLLESEENEVFSLLQKYVHTIELNMTRSSDICLILSAKLNNLPFDVAENGSQSNNGEQSPLNLRPVPNVVPSAPSASIVTLNNLSGVSPGIEETGEMSMLQETCCFPGCNLFVSRFTEPFCWEHVNQGNNSVRENRPEQRNSEFVEISLVNERCKEARCPHFASRFIYPYCYEHVDKRTVESVVRARPRQNLLSSESSVVMEHCRHGNCRNYASQYIYPFCYEHLEDHSTPGGGSIRNAAAANEPATLSREYDMSIMAEYCAHPNCNNHSSKYTFPVCYEHLDSPLAITRAAVATRVVQLPHAGQSNRSPNRIHPAAAALEQAPEVQAIDKKFEEAMKELEARTRNGPLCLKPGCTNFGNSRCRGYCHSCHSLLNRL